MQQLGGDDRPFRQCVLEQFGAHHVLFLPNLIVGKFNGLAELLQAVVLADGADGSRFAVPILWPAIDACRHRGTLAVYGDAAQDGGRAVGFHLVSVDIR